VHPKPFLSLWYVWRKPCTYHAPELTLSPKGPKGDSTWPTSPRSSIRCIHNDFLRLWYVWCKLLIYVAPRLILSINGPKRDSTWPTSPRRSIRASQMISELTVHSVQTVHLSWIKISPVSNRTETRFQLSLVTKEYQLVRPKWFLRLWNISRKPCTYLALKLTPLQTDQNEVPFEPCHPEVPSGASKTIFLAYGTYGANHAPIMHQN
jgi:hypothetical protein